jgi:hypothetical protein
VNKDCTFHRPTTSTKKKSWLAVLKSNCIVVHHRATLVLCSNHFEEKYFTNIFGRQRMLKTDAVPSIFTANIPSLSKGEELNESVGELPIQPAEPAISQLQISDLLEQDKSNNELVAHAPEADGPEDLFLVYT